MWEAGGSIEHQRNSMMMLMGYQVPTGWHSANAISCFDTWRFWIVHLRATTSLSFSRP